MTSLTGCSVSPPSGGSSRTSSAYRAATATPLSAPWAGRIGLKLPQDAKDRLQFAKITVTELETDDEGEIRELFQRLQQGEPLNAAEKRNAMDVPVRDFVANSLAKHPAWPETGLKSKRFGLHEISAIILALVAADGPTGLKGADLLSLYEDLDFDPSDVVATRTVELLDQLQAVAAVERGTLRTRWGIVDLLLSLKRLDESGIAAPPGEVMEFIVGFEQERRAAAAALSDLRSIVMDLPASEVDAEEKLELPQIEPDMLTYVNAFTREGATKENVATLCVPETRSCALTRHDAGRSEKLHGSYLVPFSRVDDTSGCSFGSLQGS